MIKTFSIQTLGCRVNQYEGDQLAALLRSRGLVESDPASADLRVVNSCSVTVQAASKSRQLTRRAAAAPASRRIALPQLTASHAAGVSQASPATGRRPRVVVTGCWATSDRDAAAALPGVDAVVGHHQDVAAELVRLLALWQGGEDRAGSRAAATVGQPVPDGPAAASAPSAEAMMTEHSPEPSEDKGWIIGAGAAAGTVTGPNKPSGLVDVNAIFAPPANAAGGAVTPGPVPSRPGSPPAPTRPIGTTTLPLLDDRQTSRQRAYLKIQDGCDAHCTYCIIPRLRPALWSKPVDDVVTEARRLVAAGHAELVLTGIFLGAYGQPTALRRRQPHATAGPLARLVDALCTRVPDLRRLRLSSLEPGDLTPDLLSALRSHGQVVPHFHLPLQSGCDRLLRRMNRQYTRGDFLGMVEQVRRAFDRPALTTDIIVGFPGETAAAFTDTMDAVDAAGFIHVHAFSYSPRPGTAAARWTRDVVRGPVVNDRIDALRARAAAHSLAFRQQFVGQMVELLVEHERDGEPADAGESAGLRHGRCERYFPVHFDDPAARAGDFVRVRVERVTPGGTTGTRTDVLATSNG